MSAMDMFWAAPPVTRTLTAAAVVVSLAAWSDILSPYYFVFLPYKILRLGMPQLWRLFTPFLLTGPKLGILMDPYFLFTWGKSVETNTARFPQPGDFFIFLMFVGSIIVVRTASRSSVHTCVTSYICPHSLVLAVVVPGKEGDHHPAVRSPIIRNLNHSGLHGAGIWVGWSRESAIDVQ